ncbi:transmembrane protein 243 [Trichonephila clavata]|uniref:Transmembrane protein 243 n=1 Tax=Trichonephila clavata TaxID=2740835 RepID=A0A8X6LBR3_TRICU|nr:transmembrane protein 243 [Trichonephila clavata]
MESHRDEYRPLFGAEITDKPLFGVTNTKDRVINLLVGLVTVLLFGVTLLSAFFAKTPPRGLNIYFIICLSLVSLSHVLLIYWYRQGDLDPKFRLLIYYNAFTMVLLSICALSFFFTEY